MSIRISSEYISLIFLILMFSISISLSKNLYQKQNLDESLGVFLQTESAAQVSSIYSNQNNKNSQKVKEQCEDTCECKSTRNTYLTQQWTTTKNGGKPRCHNTICQGKWVLIKTDCCGTPDSHKLAIKANCVECGTICGVYQCNSDKKTIYVDLPWKC